MYNNFSGLSESEVKQKRSLGLSNDIIDTYTPTTLKIVLRNIFSLINLILIPLMTTLYIFDLKREVLAFGTFAILNTLVSAFDELRIKRQLDQLKSQFQQTANVIRDGVLKTIPVSQVVMGDYIKASAGEGVIADGKIVSANYLQTDESMLTGESNYIQKETGEKILAASYVVTGECIYEVESVGKNNYLNRLGTEALKYKEKKSSIQSSGDKLITFLVIASLVLSMANFFFTQYNGASVEERLLSITTIIALIIPQTLIFLFTLTFAISITKLYNKGILIQKGGSIEELSKINVICFDKTGTITTNEMKIVDVEYFNLEKEEIGEFYSNIKQKIVSINKTQSLLNEYFGEPSGKNIKAFDQIPFTSKNKFSALFAEFEDTSATLVFGAYSMLQNSVKPDLRGEIEKYINREEKKGNRVLVGMYLKDQNHIKNLKEGAFDFKSESFVVFSIEEELNPGIKEIFESLKDQGIQIKIISGDSLTSVQKVLQKVGIDSSKAVDLTNSKEISEEICTKNNIFTRARPEDKLEIIKGLQAAGFKVAMVGDGINDVLSIKAADVSIAMESGSKIARDVSDIVLLNNDYNKIPQIFFEGENIIFNLKLTTKLFLFKSLTAIFIASYFTAMKQIVPINPASTLVFSFLGSSAPSYVIVFTRQKIKNSIGFFKEVLNDTLLQSLAFSVLIAGFYTYLKSQYFTFMQINTALVIFILSVSVLYSLILVWKSKKLSNIFIAGFVYVLLLTIGIMETLLPVTIHSRTWERIGVTGIVLIGGVLLSFALLKILKPKKNRGRVLATLGGLAAVPVALFFPFNDYYQITKIPTQIYPMIFGLSLVSVLIILILNLITSRLKPRV
jgi:cation-transporting P-type ATPase E